MPKNDIFDKRKSQTSYEERKVESYTGKTIDFSSVFLE